MSRWKPSLMNDSYVVSVHCASVRVKAIACLGRFLTFLCTLSFLKISVASRRCWFSKILPLSVTFPRARPPLNLHILLSIPCQQGQVQDERHPVSVDQEQDSQESMYSSFRDDVGVEAVTKIDRVDVVAAAKSACILRNGCLESLAAQSSP
jgi:hypothetical protein